MKRTSLVTSVIWFAAVASSGCARNTEPEVPPPGGQSGDDGDVDDRDPEPIPPGLPEPPCDSEETRLGLEEQTVFGATARGLIDNLAIANALPFFWVAFDAQDGVAYTPGPGQASVSFGIEARPSEEALQTIWQPDLDDPNAGCPSGVVEVPVRLSIATADDALDAQVDAMLDFTSAKTAELSVTVPMDALGGSFAFSQLGETGQGYEAGGLIVHMKLWPGGSRGELEPLLTPIGPPQPPSGPSATPMSPSRGAIPVPTTPAGRSVVAVWPRPETCVDGRGGSAYAATDAIIGVSPLAVVSELGARAERRLLVGDADVPVRFTLEALPSLVCVSTLDATMTFDVRGRLSADGAEQGSSMENLDANAIFTLEARAASDGSGLETLRWARRDAGSELSRQELESETGMALGAPEEYEQFWWSWDGVDTRSGATVAWSSVTKLQVTSLNAQQTAEAERVMQQGGPGPGVSFDGPDVFPVLPGDVLLEAHAP